MHSVATVRLRLALAICMIRRRNRDVPNGSSVRANSECNDGFDEASTCDHPVNIIHSLSAINEAMDDDEEELINWDDIILNGIESDNDSVVSFADRGLDEESNLHLDSSLFENSQEQVDQKAQVEQMEPTKEKEEKEQIDEVEQKPDKVDASMTLHQQLNSTLNSLHESTTAVALDHYARLIVDMLMQCNLDEQHSFMEQCRHICEHTFTLMNVTLYHNTWNDFLLALFRNLVTREAQIYPLTAFSPLQTATVSVIISNNSSGHSASDSNTNNNDTMIMSDVFELRVSRQLLLVYTNAITETLINSSTLLPIPVGDQLGGFLCKLADLYMTPVNSRNRYKLSVLQTCISHGTSGTALETMNVLLLQATREWKEQKTWLVNTMKSCLSELWKSGKCSDQYTFFGKMHALIHQLTQ